MNIKDIQGYIEGKDISKIGIGHLAYPSKNVLITKGKIVTRGGIENDGVLATVEEAVHSEFVWKDALSGSIPMRVHGNTVEIKYNNKWYTIFTGLDADTIRVFFTTWIDNNGSIVKKRLVFCDGSTNLYSWNGAIATVGSATSNSVVIDGSKTCEQLGFDNGSSVNQTLLHFIGSNVIANSEELQNNNPTANTLTIAGTFNTTPIAGDIIITKPVTFANEISSTYNIDVVATYKNHIVCANYGSVQMYFSHITTFDLTNGFDFAMPSSGSRTAITPILVVLDGNFTAMISKKDIFWVSDADDWYKMTKSVEQNAYGLWLDVEKFENGERKGALPMAVAKYKGDIIYVSQDKTVQRVTSAEFIDKDEIKTISDDVESMFRRLDLTDIRVYYLERAIYFILPNESTMLILDMEEGYYQPPQILPIHCMSVIEGIKYGHHNAENSTYELFTGRNDLDTPIESIIAFGYQAFDVELGQKQNTIIGISGRLTTTTTVSVKMEYEENSAKSESNFEFNGTNQKTFALDDDVSYATHPYGSRSWAGADMETEELRRIICFKKLPATSHFETRPVFTITGDDNEFHLLTWFIDEQKSNVKIPQDLFIK